MGLSNATAVEATKFEMSFSVSPKWTGLTWNRMYLCAEHTQEVNLLLTLGLPIAEHGQSQRDLEYKYGVALHLACK